jgi:hypothetical protein
MRHVAVPPGARACTHKRASIGLAERAPVQQAEASAQLRDRLVDQHRTGTPPSIPCKPLIKIRKRQLGGVPIGADRDPSLQKLALITQRLVADPGGVPLRC